MTRSPIDPLRVIIIVAVTLVAVVRLTYWLQEPSASTRSTPSPPLPTALPGTAIVEGAVTDDTGAPIASARVTLDLESTQAQWHKAIDSDLRGGFAFTEVPAGRLTLSAQKHELNRADQGHQTVLLTIGPSDRLTQTLVMRRMASISGTVYGRDGKRALAGYVRAFSRTANSLGNIQAFTSAYTISGLYPGEYVVMTAVRYIAEPRFFHPATWRASEAKPISLKAGELRENVDIHMIDVPTSSISGKVVQQDGTPADGITVRVSDADGVTDEEPRSMVTDTNGQFTFAGLPLDRYWVAASGHRVWARQLVSLTKPGLAPVRLTLEPGGRITGRVVLPPASDSKSLPRIMLYLEAVDRLGRVWARDQLTTGVWISEDRTFALEGVAPGQYRLEFAASHPADSQKTLLGIVDRLSLDAIRLPSGKIDAPLVVTAGATISDVIVHLVESSATIKIKGIARHTDGSPAAQVYVVTFPADERVFPVPGFRVSSAHAQLNGAFNIGLLRSGDYYVATVPEREWTGRRDAAYLETLRPGATRVSVAPGQTVKHDVTIR